ncbi:hypothetical protein NL676_033587 [Syzygium grande]|nr:hypothetical protein NL676_033587 [Syzygium grande]
MFGAVVFVFAMHPFDVKDRCVVDGVELNEQAHMTLQDCGEKISYSNAIVICKPISNFNWSLDGSDSVEFTVDFSPLKGKALKICKIKYLDSKPKHWHPDPSVVIKEIADVGNLKVLKRPRRTTADSPLPSPGVGKALVPSLNGGDLHRHYYSGRAS